MWVTALLFCTHFGGNFYCQQKNVDNLMFVRILCTGLLEVERSADFIHLKGVSPVREDLL